MVHLASIRGGALAVLALPLLVGALEILDPALVEDPQPRSDIVDQVAVTHSYKSLHALRIGQELYGC